MLRAYERIQIFNYFILFRVLLYQFALANLKKPVKTTVGMLTYENYLLYFLNTSNIQQRPGV